MRLARFKRVKLLSLSLLFVISANPSPAIADALKLPNEPAFVFYSTEEYFVNSLSRVIALKDGQWIDCLTGADAKCAKVTSLSAVSVLPPCSLNLSDQCISGIEVSDAMGSSKKGSLIEMLKGSSVAATPALGLSFGGSISLWQTTAAAGTPELYLVHAYQQFQSFPNNQDCSQVTKPTQCLMTLGRFSATVVPVSRSTTDCISLGANAPEGCFARRDFANEQSLKLQLQVNSGLTGFISGRITDATISVSQISPSLNKLEIAGKAQNIPSAQANFLKSEVAKSPELTALMQKGFGEDVIKQPANQMYINGAPPGSSFNQYLLLAEKAIAVNTVKSLWRAQSFTTTSDSNCLNDRTRLLGFVTTNAAGYQSKPPTFDAASGTLEYQVGSPHFAEDGSVYKGRYELILRSDVARCLYKFTSAPVQATISISDGSSVATTAQVEKDGWLKFSAFNFEFSNPIIKIKLSQAKEVVASTPGPSAAPVAKKNTTITCVKGKATKQVIGVNPKCPAGFKKK